MTTTAPSSITFVRELITQANEFLEQIMAEVTPEMAHWQPPGKALPIGAHYAHVVLGADGFVNAMLAGGAPLFVTNWAGRTGLSELPPDGDPEPGAAFPSWDAWARTMRIDLPQFRTYAQAVYRACDDYFASLRDADLSRMIDLSMAGLGTQTLGWTLGAGVAGHAWSHYGEISCVKGLQGASGYPV